MKKYLYLLLLYTLHFTLYTCFTGCERKKELFGTKGDLISGKIEPLTGTTTTTTTVATPTGLTATGGDRQITLKWNYVSGANCYKIYRSQYADGPYEYKFTMYSMNSWSDSSVTNGYTYYYKVSAVDYYGHESGWSNWVSATPYSSISAPTGLTAIPGNNQVSLSWYAVSGASYYRVYRSYSDYGYSMLAGGDWIYSNSYTDTTATNGTLYYYKVSAVDGSGKESSLSSYIAATPVSPISAPTWINATTPAANQVSLSWGSVSGAWYYKIYRSSYDGGYVYTYTAYTPSTSMIDSMVTSGCWYYYKVSAVDYSYNESSLSCSVSAVPW